MPSTAPYMAFISYRHADNAEEDKQWASWLHKQLETYEVPADLIGTSNLRGEPIPERIFPVFIDELSLPADANLSSAITDALERSRYLIVLCSPGAVASRYVNEEILHFKKLGRSNEIMAALIEGEPNASIDPAKTELADQSQTQECFPKSLQYSVDEQGHLIESQPLEPIAANFRLPNGSKGFTNPQAYHKHLLDQNPKSTKQDKARFLKQTQAYEEQINTAKLKVVAGILGVGLEQLTQRDKLYQLNKARIAARRARRVASSLAMLALVASVSGGLAYKLHKDSQVLKYNAELEAGRALMQEANTQVRDGGQTPALILGIRALNLTVDKSLHPSSEPLIKALESGVTVSIKKNENYSYKFADSENKLTFSPRYVLTETQRIYNSFSKIDKLGRDEYGDRSIGSFNLYTGEEKKELEIEEGNLSYLGVQINSGGIPFYSADSSMIVIKNGKGDSIKKIKTISSMGDHMPIFNDNYFIVPDDFAFSSSVYELPNFSFVRNIIAPNYRRKANHWDVREKELVIDDVHIQAQSFNNVKTELIFTSISSGEFKVVDVPCKYDRIIDATPSIAPYGQSVIFYGGKCVAQIDIRSGEVVWSQNLDFPGNKKGVSFVEHKKSMLTPFRFSPDSVFTVDEDYIYQINTKSKKIVNKIRLLNIDPTYDDRKPWYEEVPKYVVLSENKRLIYLVYTDKLFIFTNTEIPIEIGSVPIGEEITISDRHVFSENNKLLKFYNPKKIFRDVEFWLYGPGQDCKPCQSGSFNFADYIERDSFSFEPSDGVELAYNSRVTKLGIGRFILIGNPQKIYDRERDLTTPWVYVWDNMEKRLIKIIEASKGDDVKVSTSEYSDEVFVFLHRNSKEVKVSESVSYIYRLGKDVPQLEIKGNVLDAEFDPKRGGWLVLVGAKLFLYNSNGIYKELLEFDAFTSDITILGSEYMMVHHDDSYLAIYDLNSLNVVHKFSDINSFQYKYDEKAKMLAIYHRANVDVYDLKSGVIVRSLQSFYDDSLNPFDGDGYFIRLVIPGDYKDPFRPEARLYIREKLWRDRKELLKEAMSSLLESYHYYLTSPVEEVYRSFSLK